MWGIIGEVAFFFFVFILIVGGLILTAIAIPGVWLIWIAILLTAIVYGLETIPIWFLIVSFLFSVFITLIDNFLIAYGSKKFGGGKWGTIGGILGLILGSILANILGLIIGSFIGAFALEYIMAKRNSEDSAKSGLGSFIAIILAIVIKIFLCFLMVGFFIYLFVS